MKISLATNFDDTLLERISSYPVEEVFGKLPRDITGGGRASYQIVGVTKRRLAAHVRAARAQGIRFNYLLNAACLDNREFTRAGQRGLRRLLDWISEIGVEAVTVASPFLLRIIKERYPHLRTRVSVFACVDHVRKARQWQDLGADCIMLDSLLVNREFQLLRALQRAVDCELQLMVNNSCLQSCALSHYHMNTLAHASQQGHRSRGFFVDWCLFRCTREKLTDPVNYIRSEWIRPEDLHHYEALGYDSFKITERGAPTEVLVQRVRAYSERHFDGNLLDLVQPYAFQRRLAGRGWDRRGFLWRLRHLFRPSLARPAKLLALKRLAEERGMLGTVDGEPPVTVDNRALDGFIDRFLRQGCKQVDCDSCRHCHAFAERAVRVDEGLRERCLPLYDELFDDLHSGAFWGLDGARSRVGSRADRRSSPAASH